MRKILTALTATALFSFTACGTAVPAGKVVDKSSEENEIMKQECEVDYDTKTYKDSKGKTKTKKVRDDDCEDVGTGEFETTYSITLEDKDGNDETHEVSEDEYNSVEVGDQFDTRD